MARDCELLAAAERGQAGCRVYFWDGVWVSLGRFQVAERDLLDPGVRWVQRPTGGKAVMHGHDITVGFALPLSLLGNPSLKSAYRAMAVPLIWAMRESGLAAVLAEDTGHSGKGRRTGDCFAFSSPNDIVHEATGQKVCGCALRLTRSAVLLQASIPVGIPLLDPASVIRGGVSLANTEWDSGTFGENLGLRLRECGEGVGGLI